MLRRRQERSAIRRLVVPPVTVARGIAFQDERDRQRVEVDRLAKIGQRSNQHPNFVHQLMKADSSVTC